MLDDYAGECSKMLLSRLHGFLQTRIPLQRIKFYPDRHWVWDSLQCKIKKICVLMILSGHIIDQKYLKFTKEDECMLHQRHHFISVEQFDMNNDMDGSYLSFDKTRNIYIRAGMGEMGIKRRWSEHVSASLRSSHVNRSSKLYSCYPNPNCKKDNIPDNWNNESGLV